MATFQPLSVIFYREGFDWRQLATFSHINNQSDFINYLVSKGATRTGDWYRFPPGGDQTFRDAIQKALDLGGKVYDLPPRTQP
jgi:hypothetical protein